MMEHAPIRRLIATFAKNVVVFLTLTVSSLALAQAIPTIGTGSVEEGEKAPYRGTTVSYGHSLSLYNPTPETTSWVHRIGLMPEWHFNDKFAVRGRLFIVQELTLSDTTTHTREVELWDLFLDGVWSGWKEKNSGIKLGADIRVTLPTSLQSQAASRLFTLGPSLNVSRHFDVLAGLTLVYSARFTYRFNRFSTRQNVGGQISNGCDLNVGAPEACINTNSGANNVQFDILHGPTVVFNPHKKVDISATLFMQRGWVAPLSGSTITDPVTGTTTTLDAAPTSPRTRDLIGFSLSVTYQPFDIVSFSLGTWTYAGQLDTTGHYIFPLFNRNTSASLDATFDLEAVVSSITKEKK
jgi:hypothetical protein